MADKSSRSASDKNIDLLMLERALHASNSGILITDPTLHDNPVVWCNPGFERMTGYSIEETLGRNCRFLQGKDTDPGAVDALREAVKQQKEIQVEILNYRKDGIPFLNDLSISPVLDEKKRLTHFIGIQQDKSGKLEIDDPVKLREYAENIVDTMREPVLILDSDLRVATANLSFYRAFEVSPHETIGCLIYELGNGQWNISSLKRLLEDILPQHTFFEGFEVTHTFPRIGARTMLLNARSFSSQEELPHRILVAIEDITHRQQTLEQSVEFARGVVDSLSAHIAILDERGVIVAVNEAWSDFALANAGGESSIGSNYLEICENAKGSCSEEAVLMARGMRDVLEDRTHLYELEYPCHAPDERRWFTGRVTRFDYGGKRYLVVAHENVTARRLSEEALHQSESRYELLVQNVDEYAMVVLDKQGTVQNWNHGAELIFGYSFEQMKGQSCDRLFPWEDQRSGIFKNELEAAFKQRRVSSSRMLVRRSGDKFWADMVTVSLLDEQNEPMGYGMVIRDFSERQSHQSSIETLNERLRRAMTETHHRVKNNLQIIAAMIDLQTLHFKNTDAEKAEEFRRLNAHVRAMAAVHEILTQEAKEGAEAHSLSAKAILEKLLPILQRIPSGKRLDFQLEDMRLPTRQGTSLAIVANELVLNALKYGQANIQVNFLIQGETALLEVLDDGPGFPPDFDPRKTANTGLDLVQSLVSWDLDALIAFENRPDTRGARVSVMIPLKGDTQ